MANDSLGISLKSFILSWQNMKEIQNEEGLISLLAA
jgi:hypothetical protein